MILLFILHRNKSTFVVIIFLFQVFFVSSYVHIYELHIKCVPIFRQYCILVYEPPHYTLKLFCKKHGHTDFKKYKNAG